MARGMPPPAGGGTGDVDAGFHHRLGFHQRHVRLWHFRDPRSPSALPDRR